jgi:hypothetical protein
MMAVEDLRRWQMSSGQNAGAAGGGAVYGIGLFGALVYFFQAAETFGEYAFAIIQTLFWPGFLVYEALKAPGA